MPEPIAIRQAFLTMSEEIMQTKPGEQPFREGDWNELAGQRVAARYGIPLDELIDAVVAEQPVAMLMMAMAGPRRAISTCQIGAFLAGVRWEQGRHTATGDSESPREMAALALVRKIYRREADRPLHDAGMAEEWIDTEIAGFIRQFGPLPEGIA